MAYDEELAARIRALAAGEPSLTEKKMFGGLAFLVGGNMAIPPAARAGSLSASIPTSRTRSSPPAMRTSWRCAAGRCRAGCASTRSTSAPTAELAKWVDLGTTYARSLPVKQ